MNQSTQASAIFAPLWRRKWLILAVGIVAGVGSYFYYRREAASYSASTQVYLGNGAEEQSHVGTSGGGKKAQVPEAATQAAVINSSIIKEAVKRRLRKEKRTRVVRAALKGKAKAKAAQKSQFIIISAEARNAKGAGLLADTTAQTYVQRTNQRYRREVLTAITLARRQARKLEIAQAERSASSAKKGGKGGSSVTATLQEATLQNKINQLESDLAISQVAQVDPVAKHGGKLVGPHPKSNAIFGFVIGLLLASLAAYALSRLDRRVRSLAAIEELFPLQVLAALPAVRRPILNRDGHPTPARSLREGLWRLQMSLQVTHPQHAEQNGSPASPPPRAILFVSADPGDGKSTLAAALALVQGEAGERVAVVEADFRSPVQSRIFSLPGGQGLADVLAGRLTVEEAMQEVTLISQETPVGVGVGAGAGAAATVVEASGSVSVLAGAAKVANPPALLSRANMGELPHALAADYDHVLVDAPGPLQVSDVMPLLAAVDGIVVLARAGHTREASATRLMQLLARTPSAPVLGVVANGVPPAEIRKYGLSADYRPGWRQRLLRR